MRTVPTWDEYFADLARKAKDRSKDPSTQVGAIIVLGNRHVTTGYNGFPKGVLETSERWERPTKYDWVVHAELNAILLAGVAGASIIGGTIFSTLYPCCRCAGAIINADLKEVVYLNKDNPRWDQSHLIAKQMFEEAGIKVRAL